jgi:hypothetical protein
MRIIRTRIERDYPHRVAYNPHICPVCCGDNRTTDSRYGGKVLYKIDEGTHNEAPIYKCLACPIWYAEVAVEDIPLFVRRRGVEEESCG